MPIFSFAQDLQNDNNFVDAHKSIGNASSRLLPTDVQNAYDVKWYFLNLNAESNTVALSGDVTIKAQVIYNVMDTFSFHLHNNYYIDSVLINGVKTNVITHEHERLITGLGMPKNTLFNAQIFYHGAYNSGGAFLADGISSTTDSRWGEFSVTWTLSEANNAYHWFPVKQDLKDKADSCRVFVTTTKPNMVASNGLLKKVVDLPANKVRYEWNSTYPIDYYLIFIAVAEYQDYSIYATIPQTGEQLLIQNFIYNSPECLADNKKVMDETKEMIKAFSEMFGKYPFSSEKYGHALAKLGGAMEHQTMTTTGGLMSNWESTIAHELVHQWFGDNVTCASWQHIWLNEGFARYGEYLWREYKFGKESAFNSFKYNIINSVVNNGKTGSVFVPLNDIDNENRIFNTTLTYNKGGVLVHMIRYEIGDNDELFYNILQTYQNRFKDKVATAEDFKNVAEELSGIDFTTFFEQWYFGEGYPKFDIKWYQNGNQLVLNSAQTTTAPSATPLFKVTYELQITYSDNSSEIIPFYHDETNKQFVYNISDNKTVNSIFFDPNYWLLASSTILKTNSIEDFVEDKSITIYPNPTTTSLHIKFENSLQGTKTISLYDVTGKNILTINTQDDLYTLDVNSFPSGTYFISFKIGKNVFVRKFNK